ncbi:MAG: 2-oxo-4-hydroxy-4-carboxy-5-ureidoimidazoline decarboxylase [Pseudomonadota bacterium]
MSLKTFNQLAPDLASRALRNCCTSEAWIDRMRDERPFENAEVLLKSADAHWAGLTESDYLQAFEGHPKIGDVNSLREKYAATKALAGDEQSGVESASDNVLIALRDGNTAYEDKFGFIFIVCATGKSAAEMLALLEARLPNNREDELRNASAEQAKITALRLRKLISGQ